MYFSFFQVNDTNIVKSGTDFRNLSKITIKRKEAQLHVDIEKVDVTSEFDEDPETVEIVKHLQGTLYFQRYNFDLTFLDISKDLIW